MHREFSFGRFDVFAHIDLLVRWQSVNDQMHWAVAAFHHLLEQFDEQLRGQGPFVGRKPEGTFGVHCGRGGNRLTLPGALNHRCVAFDRPGLAMHRVSPKSRFVSEVDVLTALLGRSGNARICFTLLVS